MTSQTFTDDHDDIGDAWVATLPSTTSVSGRFSSSRFDGYGEDSTLDLGDLSDRTARQVCDRLLSREFGDWATTVARVRNCAHPIKLRGSTETIDSATGEVLSSYHSADEPFGFTYVACGNRRASECLACSRVYAADMFHLIRAGVTGGKTVPTSVADHPLVFAILTAPSFGKVHTRPHGGGSCHPTITRARLCRHGRHLSCATVHGEDDPVVGQAMCRDCYDYASHVVWQWHSPDLWRRFTIALRRQVAKHLGICATRLGEVATVQYAKVVEFQHRGAVHFHTLIRLDGPRTPAGFAAAPAGLGADVLADLVTAAAIAVRLQVPGVDTNDPARLLVFGRQLDVRPVHNTRHDQDPSQSLTAEQVAGYLAKYTTKSATDGTETTPHHRRLRATIAHLANRNRRTRLQGTVVEADGPGGTDGDAGSRYRLLGKWAHMLGFRGHYASKSRRYSITLGQLRRARHRARTLIAQAHRDGKPLDLAAREADLMAEDDDTDTTLVIRHWNYVSSGWATDGDRALATASAARAREYAQWKAQQARTNQHSGRVETRR